MVKVEKEQLVYLLQLTSKHLEEVVVNGDEDEVSVAKSTFELLCDLTTGSELSANIGTEGIDGEDNPSKYLVNFKEESDKPKEAVNHPSHYNMYSREVIEVIDEWVSPFDGATAFYLGNVLKYISRCAFKGSTLQDLNKSKKYLELTLERLKKSKSSLRHALDTRSKEFEETLENAYTFLEMAIERIGATKKH